MSIGAADESVCGGVEITQRTVLITDRAATTTHISDCLGQWALQLQIREKLKVLYSK